MKHSNLKLYRTLRKTPQSRSIRITLNSGFTLIELLVVVAIISLLTTVVLGAMSDARIKARNSAKNSLVMEYIKALEMYRGDNDGSYPVANEFVCFGYRNGSDENCLAFYPGDNNKILQQNITNLMQPYFSGDFAERTNFMIGEYNYKGVLYKCPQNDTDSSCNQYSLEWQLEKRLNGCISNSHSSSPLPTFRYCIYPQI